MLGDYYDLPQPWTYLISKQYEIIAQDLAYFDCVIFDNFDFFFQEILKKGLESMSIDKFTVSIANRLEFFLKNYFEN